VRQCECAVVNRCAARVVWCYADYRYGATAVRRYGATPVHRYAATPVRRDPGTPSPSFLLLVRPRTAVPHGLQPGGLTQGRKRRNPSALGPVASLGMSRRIARRGLRRERRGADGPYKCPPTPPRKGVYARQDPVGPRTREDP
jgi:hypothetical protein